MLLYPLADQLRLRRKGFDQQLAGEGIKLASNGVLQLALVLGEHDYCPKFGFVRAADYRLEWQGSIETERLQLSEHADGSLAGPKKMGLAVRAIALSNYYDMKMLGLYLSVRWHGSFG